MTAGFGLDTETRGDAVTVRVSGELDVASAPELGEVLDRIAEAPPARVVIDLAGVTFLGSAGLGVLVQARRDLAAHDARLVLASVSGSLLRVFEIVHLHRTFEFDPPGPAGP